VRGIRDEICARIERLLADRGWQQSSA